MIIGLGSDLCDIRRVQRVLDRHGERFLARVFTEVERGRALRRTETLRAGTLAKRFAAKEACAKALGTGITDRVRWTHIEILADQSGRLELHLSEGALRRARRLAGNQSVKAHLSMTQDRGFVMAFVLLDAS